MKGIAVDASTINGNPGDTECRGVDLETGKIVFSEQVGKATNNIGEYLAIAYGMEYLVKNNLNLPVYSDSMICIKWANFNFYRTKFFIKYGDIASKNPGLRLKLEIAKEKIKECRPYIELKFWNNRIKENPADYNRK